MKPAIENLILKQIEEAESLIDSDNEVSSDYTSLKESLLQKELQQEITFLRTLLDSQEDFAKQFQARLKWRSSNPDKAIAFRDLPASPSNQLYWNLVNILFEPKTMQEMLTIMQGTSCVHLQVSLFDEYQPGSKRVKGIVPDVTLIENLADLTATPSAEELAHYVLTKDMVLDVRDLQAYSLPIHVNLKQLLDERYPEIAEKLYSHNSSLEQLEFDIDILNNKGATPKAVLDKLMKGLKLGGTQMTRKDYAGKSAENARARFLFYYHALTEENRNKLRDLKSNTKTLGQIIDVQILLDNCVETTADDINDIVEANSKLVFMNVPPEMQLKDLKDLIQKYDIKSKGKPLVTQHESPVVIPSPEQLVKKALENLTLENEEDLVDLLLNFPPSFYTLLFQNGHFKHPAALSISDLAQIITQGYFSSAQRVHLAEAIAPGFQIAEATDQGFQNKKFNPSSMIIWSLITEDPIFVNKALQIASEQEKIDALNWKIDRSGGFNTLTQGAASVPDVLKTLKKFYTDDQLLAAAKMVDSNEQSALHYAVAAIESLNLILNLYPVTERLEAVKALDYMDNSLLHYAADSQCLQAILDLYPTLQEKLEAVEAANEEGETVVHKAAENPECLKIILGLYPDDLARLEAVEKVNIRDESSIYYAVKNAESLKIILGLYPDDDARLEAVKPINRQGKTVLHEAASCAESLSIVLNLYPESERLTAVKTADEDGDNVVSEATFRSDEYPELINILLKSLPKTQRLEAFKDINDEGDSLLHYLEGNLKIINTVLDLLPEEQVLDAAKLENKEGKSVLHAVADYPESLKKILGLYPEDERIPAVEKEDADGRSVIYYATGDRLSFKIILNLYPEDQRIALVEKIINDPDHAHFGKSLFGENIDDESILEIILDLYPEQQRLERLKTLVNKEGVPLLVCAAESSIVFELVLKKLPGNHRLEAIKELGKDGEYPLCYRPSDGSFIEIIRLLPSKDLWEAVILVDFQGVPFLNCLEGDIKVLKLILELLPENRKFEFLHTSILGTSILSKLLDAKVAISSKKPEMKNSFIPDYLVIRSYPELRSPQQNSSPSFFQPDGQIEKLKQSLDQSITFEEVQQELTVYVEKNQDTPLAKRISRRLNVDEKQSLAGHFNCVS